MSSTTWLTTADAEEHYGFPAKTFAAWCRDGKIAGACKDHGQWYAAEDAFVAFLQANPQLKPPDRSVAAQVPRATLARPGRHRPDPRPHRRRLRRRDIIRGGDRTLLWIIIAVLSAGLWISALIILTAKRPGALRVGR